MRRLFLLVVVALAAVGCSFTTTGPTGDTASDATAAQQFLPNISGYNRTNADSITDAISSISGGAALISGNPVAAALVSRIDAMIQCYQDVGAVAANVYTQVNLEQVLAGEVPKVGAVAVVNQDRIARNFLNCVVGGAANTFSAQSVEPCGGSGTKTVGGETIHFVYAGTDPNFCVSVQQHFDGLN